MKKYLIVSDLDGTLADTDHMVNEHTKSFIRKILDDGHHFYISTGRMRALVEYEANSIDPRVGFVASNGGLIQTHNGFHKTLLENDDKVTLYEYVIKHDIPTLFFTEDEVMYTHSLPQFFDLDKEEKESIDNKIEELDQDIEELQRKVIKVKDIQNDIIDKEIINVLLTAVHIENPVDILDNAKKDLEKLVDLNISSSNSDNLELYSKETSKGHALITLMKQYNIDKENVIVFGDGHNDISMFKEAHTSVAMGNATPDLKSIATHHTVTNGENGVVKFLKNFL